MAGTLLTAQSRNMTVCFSGHRQLAQEELPALVSRLKISLEALYHRGYRQIICGGALGFDTLAAECVYQMKNVHDDVKLILALPHAGQSRGWAMENCQRYEQNIYHADEIHVLSQSYYAGCMMVRNRFMLNHASFCLCYMTEAKGGTAATIAYAAQEGLDLLNLAMEDACAAFAREKT